ncbi:MAG: MarP family serine protease, partial [Tepidiformaceae bacterium]
GDIEPGNSGGPFVDVNGTVMGVVFARSLSSPGQGFALAPAEIQPDLDSLAAGAPIFDSGRFRCAE